MSIFARLSVALLCVLSAAAVSAQTQATKLQGVWKIVEVKESGPDASTNSTPQPGIMIISAKHYSAMRIGGDTPRPRIPEDVSKATLEQLRAAWGAFFANAGTYAISGDKVTYSPIVAKNPGYMMPGMNSVSTFRLEGNTLWLTQFSANNQPVQNPGTLKLIRLE